MGMDAFGILASVACVVWVLKSMVSGKRSGTFMSDGDLRDPWAHEKRDRYDDDYVDDDDDEDDYVYERRRRSAPSRRKQRPVRFTQYRDDHDRSYRG